MPASRETRASATNADAFLKTLGYLTLDTYLKAAIKQDGFTSTLKSLQKGTLPVEMMTVVEGVVQEQPSGLYDAALQTREGRVVLQGARRTDRQTIDPQSVSSNRSPNYAAAPDSDPITPAQLLSQLTDAGASPPSSLICELELARFDAAQRQVLLPLLWQFILHHRNSNDRDQLVAVGAAIRKYIAIMPMDQMGTLALLLESGHRSPLPIELEIEVAKMVYRNFEVHPPLAPDPHPVLAERLWELVQAYINPRILLRDKHSAAASLAIEAIVAMRSKLAGAAWQAAVTCPYRWFAELVNDDLDGLHDQWSNRSPEVAAWLDSMRKDVAV